MQAVENETLESTEVKFSKKSACCVVMASEGYPVKYEKGFEITADDDFDALLYVAGAAEKDGKTVTSGGRVLGVTATADDLKSAIDKAYENVTHVHFDNAFYRRDIGQRALKAAENK